MSGIVIYSDLSISLKFLVIMGWIMSGVWIATFLVAFIAALLVA